MTARRGQSGVTHCGAWTPVPPADEYGWTTRLVCIREPDHRGKHRGRTGHEWVYGGTPTMPTRRR